MYWEWLSTMNANPPQWERHMINNLTSILDFQAQALTLRSERQRLLASNIADADTPGCRWRSARSATR